MDTFLNYKEEKCYLTEEQQKHITNRHPDVNLELISKCLLSPLEVRKSSSKTVSHLYYITKIKNKFFCVVLKICADGNFIATAYTTNKIKAGQIIYQEEN